MDRAETYLLGYLSAGEVLLECGRAEALLRVLKGVTEDWNQVSVILRETYDDAELPELESLVTALRNSEGADATVDGVRSRLEQDKESLDSLSDRVEAVQNLGDMNTDVYLTWDHMDIYFATSMRRRREYEQLYDFVSDLMQTAPLADLRPRHFDPTQSFEKNRIDKGLIEALMLKRAACTVYSIQDNDTLGKDSELAATLAQGKPVIAYAPQIDVEKTAEELMHVDPRVILGRWNFVQGADASARRLGGFAEEFEKKLEAVTSQLVWTSLPAGETGDRFCEEHGPDLMRFGKIIADFEKRIYNKRANTLKDAHPLGIQVHLETGVANGVLVVRDVPSCAELVHRIMTNQMVFEIVDDNETDSWLLVEEITQCAYRVVTRNPKLTNCFWNFYKAPSR